MKSVNWKISFGKSKDFNNKEEIAFKCLEVANEARFPTDYNDVYEHLFGEENYKICIVFDEYNNICGFSIFAMLHEINTLHLRGIVLHPRAQEKGISLKMLQKVIESEKPTFFTAKTHNPRMFETASRLACELNSFYPNVDEVKIPEYI